MSIFIYIDKLLSLLPLPPSTRPARSENTTSQTMPENLWNLLPVEMWGEILPRAVGSIELSVRLTDSKSHRPWDLALVCKEWRDAVHSTPCIWSHISLTDSPIIGNDDCNSALLSVLKLCLHRSCNHPLTLELTTRLKKPSCQLLAALNLLMEHAQRWESVAFKASHGTLFPYLSDLPVQYTCLRHVCIDNLFEQPEEKWAGLFQDAPILSSISLNRICYHRRLSAVGIPWSQISHLQMFTHVGDLDNLMDILKRTSNLETLEYSTLYTRFGEGASPILELSQLKRLVWTTQYEIDSGRGPATAKFFELLTAPQLSVLKITGADGDRQWGAIRGCLQRSKCPAVIEASTACPHSLS